MSNSTVICCLMSGFWLFQWSLTLCQRYYEGVMQQSHWNIVSSKRSNSIAYRAEREKWQCPSEIAADHWVGRGDMLGEWEEQWHSPAPEECHKMSIVQLSVPCLQNSSPPTPINLNFFSKVQKELWDFVLSALAAVRSPSPFSTYSFENYQYKLVL